MLGGNKIKVRAGQPLKIEVPIEGSPVPLVSWKKDGKDLTPSPRVGYVISC